MFLILCASDSSPAYAHLPWTMQSVFRFSIRISNIALGQARENTNSRTFLAWKEFTKTNRCRNICRQPKKTKSARGPDDTPQVHLTLFFLAVQIGSSVFVLVKRPSRQFSTLRRRARRTVSFRSDRSVGKLICQASNRPAVHPAACLPDRPVVRVLDSAG